MRDRISAGYDLSTDPVQRAPVDAESVGAESEFASERSRIVSYLATLIVLTGCVVVTIHLFRGSTAALGIPTRNILEAWPYVLGFSLVVGGLVLVAAQELIGYRHLVVTAGSCLVAIFAFPVAYFGLAFSGIFTDSEEVFPALVAVHIAAIAPIALAIADGALVWRDRARPPRQRLRAIVYLVAVGVVIAVGRVIFARLGLEPAAG